MAQFQPNVEPLPFAGAAGRLAIVAEEHLVGFEGLQEIAGPPVFALVPGAVQARDVGFIRAVSLGSRVDGLADERDPRPGAEAGRHPGAERRRP